MQTQKKGFTLIELLIVIGILAVLATVTVLVLNPAELFRQARDSQRLSDLGTIKGALGLYVTTVAAPDIDGGTNFDDCSTDFSASVGSASSTFSGRTIQQAGVFTTDGEGWIPVDLSAMPGGSPLSVLPRDPRNVTGTTGDGHRTTGGHYYTYACDASNLTFVLKANMESTRYTNTGSDDVESTDGGPDNYRFETGTYPGLSL